MNAAAFFPIAACICVVLYFVCVSICSSKSILALQQQHAKPSVKFLFGLFEYSWIIFGLCDAPGHIPGGCRGLMDRKSDLQSEVVGSNLGSGRNCPRLRLDP